MQSRDDFGESNTTGGRRNSQRVNEDVEKPDQLGINNESPYDKTSDDSKRQNDNSSCQTNKRDTVLKRFKKRMLRKSSRDRSDKASLTVYGHENFDGRPESIEENVYFEGHIYEVPFIASSQSSENDRAVGATDKNSGKGENIDNLSQRNSLRNSWNDEVENGSVELCGGGDASAGIRKERFRQGKSMSLPARSPGEIPLPQVLPLAAEAGGVPSDMSSEDSSSEDWVQPPPMVKPDSRSLRRQSLPTQSKLQLNYQFLKGLNDLCKCGWYWGPLSSKEAEVKLDGKPDGAFLVRDSNDKRYLLSLSFRSSQTTLHTRIEFCKGKFSFYSAPFISAGCFASVIDLIDNCLETSKKRVYCYTKGRALNGATFPVRLTRPVSRFEYACTLQHLCRFVIRQHYTLENISDMPLPQIMKRYLGKNQFDVEMSE